LVQHAHSFMVGGLRGIVLCEARVDECVSLAPTCVQCAPYNRILGIWII
jgi:hypothetical protein